jgi:hypothetical protein
MIVKRKEKTVVGANRKCEIGCIAGKDMVTVLLPATASETYSCFLLESE